jgi:hypothetical protein
MSVELMKQALEALEKNYALINGTESLLGLDQIKDTYYAGCFDVEGTNKQTNDAITALRIAIEQAEELADWEAIAADQAMTISMMTIEQEKAQEDNEQLIYDAWRDSEAYGIPMTEEGGKLAEIRLRSFRRGWEYHRFYLKHGDVYMKDYLERQDYDE